MSPSAVPAANASALDFLNLDDQLGSDERLVRDSVAPGRSAGAAELSLGRALSGVSAF